MTTGITDVEWLDAKVCELSEELVRIRKDARAYANVALSEENDTLMAAMKRAKDLIWTSPVEAEKILTLALAEVKS